MRIEISNFIDVEELAPGDLYTDRDQEWWDKVIADKRIGVHLYLRGAYEVPGPWKGSSVHRVVIKSEKKKGFLPFEDPEPEVVEGDDEPDEIPLDSDDPESTEDGPNQVQAAGG